MATATLTSVSYLLDTAAHTFASQTSSTHTVSSKPSHLSPIIPASTSTPTALSNTITALPLELLIHILSHLPPTSLPNARLVCSSFNTIIGPTPFRTLPCFLDPATAKETARSALRNLPTRPQAAWSPDCSVPDELHVPECFLRALYLGVTGRRWRGGVEATEKLGIDRFRREIGRGGLTDEVVREVLFRYMLYLSYVQHQRDDGERVWSIKSSLWSAPAALTVS